MSIYLNENNTLTPIAKDGSALHTETMETIGGTASKAYSVGKYFIGTDGLLYKVTAAIARGGTITVNTNCVKTSVEEELEGGLITHTGLTLDNVNLDTVLSPGIYSAKQNCTNNPAGSDAKLVVTQLYDNSNCFIQIVISKRQYLYFRVYDSTATNNWSTWHGFMRDDGGAIFGDFFRKNTNADIKQSNNGSSTANHSYIDFKDKNNVREGGLQLITRPSGSVDAFIQLRNYKTDGVTEIYKGIWMFLSKAGVLTYQFDDGANANAALGTGYGTCDTAAATAAKTATLANYNLAPNGYVTIKFTNAVPANATLNINSKGAKPIYYRGAPISNRVINTGDRATFIYNGSQYDLVSIDSGSIEQDHNVPRKLPKEITSYVTDGSLWKRLNGTDGYSLFEDIYVGDYIKMSRAITAPGSAVTGSQYVTIIGIDTHYGDGDTTLNIAYHHLVLTAGQGYSGDEHFGKSRMNATNTSAGGYVGSELHTSKLGSVVSQGSTASGATINQQLYAEFGSHLKTTRELLTTGINATGYNKKGTNDGCANAFAYSDCQAVLMSEIQVYGSTVWSSSGYDTGNACQQYPLFRYYKQARNNRTSWYWLKDICSATEFCRCYFNGAALTNVAADGETFVRPRFILA